MRIGQAARTVGMEASTIRFYESAGLLPDPARTDGGYRDYSADDLDLMRFVKRARSLEIPLGDIRQIVELRNRGQAPCDVVRDVIDRESVMIDARIEELRQLRTELRRLQRLAAAIADDWPSGACVCHVVESTARPQRG
ncbi:MAG: MerR family transcriptional regulator [Acidimicrobiia bacterium]